MNIVLLGAPGAGKGTQARKLASLLGVPQISTGDMLREAINAGDALGDKVKGIMAAGQLVPDAIIIEVVRGRLGGQDCVDGFILDGFPRTVEQGNALESLLQDMGRSISKVLYIDTDFDELVIRITGRRTCGVCGEIYHLKYSPPPSPDTCRCGAKNLVKRVDDEEETVKSRIAAYMNQTSPLIAYYETRGVLCRISDSGLTPEQIFEKMRVVLDR